MVSQIEESTSVNVVLSEDLHIPGSSQLEVHGRLTGIATTQTMLVEGRDISQRPLVLIATAVVKPSMGKGAAEVLVRILNLSPDGVKELD